MIDDDDEIDMLKLWPLMDKSEGIYSIYPFHAFMKISPWRILKLKLKFYALRISKLRISSQIGDVVGWGHDELKSSKNGVVK